MVPRWLTPLRGWVQAVYRPFIADFSGFDQQWRVLAEVAADPRVTDAGPGWMARGYLAGARPIQTNTVEREPARGNSQHGGPWPVASLAPGSGNPAQSHASPGSPAASARSWRYSSG